MGQEFQLYGIFGSPLRHTLSPAMQEAAFRALGLKAFYLSFEVRPEEFRRLMRGLGRLTLEGFNVTVPYKEEIVSYLDELSPEARAIGAVNTVIRRGKRWIGFNTDSEGFIQSLEKEGRFRPRGKRILILGAGGSARAAAYALAGKGARLIAIANRTLERAEKLVKKYRRLFLRTKFQAMSLRDLEKWLDTKKIDLVVNATSVGLRPKDPVLVSPSHFPRRTLFVDVIYNPKKTRFLRLARSRGHRTLNGRGMLLYQGAKAFSLWTGRKAPLEVMRQELEKAPHDH